MYLKKINLKNKYALVTGAGKGLGRACSIALAEAGATIIGLSRTKSDLDKLEKDTGRKKSLNEIQRVWFSVVPWSWGQLFQLGDQVLTHWDAGDVYTFPFDIPHATMNFGFDLKYSVGVIGEKL